MILMQLMTERPVDPGQPLASPPTLCRLKNHMSCKILARIAKVFVEILIQLFDSVFKELVLERHR